jgi:NAD dependent epimerase/dehydratase family enzyme
MVLFSQRMVPARLKEAGFRWRYEDLEAALRSIYREEA